MVPPLEICSTGSTRTIDIAVSFVTHDQGKTFGHVPGEVGRRPRDRLRGSQAVAVVGVGVFDFSGCAFFGTFYR